MIPKIEGWICTLFIIITGTKDIPGLPQLRFFVQPKFGDIDAEMDES